MIVRTAPLLLLALVAGSLLAGSDVFAKGSLTKVEREFEAAISKVSPCVVVCLPEGIDPKQIPSGVSGVVVSRKGLVLSDKDVGWYLAGKGKDRKVAHTDDIEIRIPNLKRPGFRSYKAKVIRRVAEHDTSLIRIEKSPSSLKYLAMGNSDELKVGDFTFAMGNAFGLSAEVPPTLTAGVVSALVPAKDAKRGKWRSIYTSAAVNPGVNGGPLVDVEGRLVGTISSMMRPVPTERFQFLGKAIPIERIRHAYTGTPEYDELFPEKTRARRDVSKESASLELVFHNTAQAAYGSVVSIEVKRKSPLAAASPGRPKLLITPRYTGSFSGFVADADGTVITSLYNLTNTAPLSERAWLAGQKVPENARVETGLDAIEAITVHLPGGAKAEATLLAYHEGLCIAVLKMKGEGHPAPLEPAPDASYTAGRFVLALGNPYGADRLPDPLLTVGMLSKRHADQAILHGPMRGLRAPWAGQWQTDAGATDGNCGGAVVDLRGRLIGMLNIWSPTQHGRNSGIAFIVPWTAIASVLGPMKEGRLYGRPLVGVRWESKQSMDEPPTVAEVVDGSAAARVGLQKGDTILEIDGKRVDTIGDVANILRNHWSGDELILSIRRGGETIDVRIVLGKRPS